MRHAERTQALMDIRVCGVWTLACGVDVGEIHEDERTVDALAPAAEEGRGHAAKSPGDVLATGDPGVSEWGNPSGARPGTQAQAWEGTGGTETSQYPEEQRGFP